MPLPVLATKLYIPTSRPKIVLRPRLVERLNERLDRKLTLVSAPAGFGKTTLVSEWVACSGRPAAWLSLDSGDSDPACFLTYLIAALQTISLQLGNGAQAALQSPQLPPVESILTGLVNEIAALADPFILVLDDYHLVDSKLIDEAIAFLLECLPPQMHLVIATREDPHLPLARLRGQDQLTELRIIDLRFTPSEAAEFLNTAMGLDLSTADISALETRTEGWIAGLQLAAISLRGYKDTSGFIKSFTGSHRFILDYLIEEVLQQQPKPVQAFLLCTSILDRLCASLCDAILPDPAAAGQETLEKIERANLFVVPLDNQRCWYRYHRLFADVLQARLIKNQPEQIVVLHQRASEWYEQNGLLHEAIQHALSAEDFERAARLAELAWPAMFTSTFQNTTFQRWMERLPDGLVRARPVLSVGYAWALLDIGELETVESRLEDAERCLAAAGENERMATSAAGISVADEEVAGFLPAVIAFARAYLALALGETSTAVTQALTALARSPAFDPYWKAAAAALLGLAYMRNGELEAAYNSVAEGMLNYEKSGRTAFAISGTVVLAEIRAEQGRLRDAIRVCEQSLRLATQPGEPALQGTADLYLWLSLLACEQGDLDTAIQQLEKSEALGASFGLPDWKYRRWLAQARTKEASGDLDGALLSLQEAERQYYLNPIPIVKPLEAWKARIWIRQGKLAEAIAWQRQSGLSADDELSYIHEFEHITLARLLIAQFRRDRSEPVLATAMSLLQRLLEAAEAGGRTGSMIEILMLQALAQGALSPRNPSAALTPLETALRLAELEKYVRIFIDEGLPMARLLSAAAGQGIMPDFARLLLKMMDTGEQMPEGSSHPSPAQPLIQPLSERELEVLRLVAQGLSNEAIGRRLFLAVSTVKGYNRIIFDKLQVQRRTEAVARARELGLL